MKRRRDEEEIFISSDSDGSDGGDSDDDDEVYVSEDEDENDDDEEETDDDDDDDDEETDDDDTDEDYKCDEGSEEDEEEEDNSYDGNAPRKARKRAFSEVYAKGDVESVKARKENREWQRLKKRGGHANSEDPLSREDQNFFAEALRIISGGDLDELKLEHCKAYLRHYSLRQTGSKQTLLDRVREHIVLKACGGMAKYPRSTFTINCTGDACTGDVVLFQQRVKNCKKSSRSSKQPSFLRRTVAGRIVKESYGSAKQQHTFTVEVLWSKGRKALPLLYPLLIKGRNLYRLKTFRQRWANEGERKRVLQEKHSRGGLARNAREDRLCGKRPSCSNQTRPSKWKAEVTLKREQTVKVSRKTVNACVPSSSRGKAGENNASEENVIGEQRTDSSFISSHRVSENTAHATSRSTKCVLSIKSSFAGLLIGSKGRNIGAIARASAARVQVCEDPLNPASRLVEITGAPGEVQVAKGMVIKSFLDKGLPPPVVTTPPGQQRQNFVNGFSMPNHNTFFPIGNASLGSMPVVDARAQALLATHMHDFRNGGGFFGFW